MRRELTTNIRIALTTSIALTFLASAGPGLHAFANGRDVTLRASLRGLREVPANITPATATLRATLDEAGKNIMFTLDYRNMSSALVKADIHFAQENVRGAPMVFFCGGGGKPACPVATSGTITGTITATDVVGPAAQGIAPGDFASVAHAIKTGKSYAEIHSNTFQEGEVRGQISASGHGSLADCCDADD
jgi:hypothetical protein